MWQAEALFRQGSWVRKFDTPDQAMDWIEARISKEAETSNPVRSSCVFYVRPTVERILDEQ